MIRIFQQTKLSENSAIRLDEQASHHLARVLRVSVGDAIVLFNGDGGEYQAAITKIDKKGVDVHVGQFHSRDVESPIAICLAQGIARGEKMDFIVQKAVELGVHSVAPIITERCNVRLDQAREAKRTLHWRAVAVSACEQSGRNRIPEINTPLALRDWLQQVTAEFRFVLSPYATQSLSAITIPNNASIALLIGPEGGLSEQEIKLAVDHQFQPLKLGPRVLRTETASLAALSVLQFCCGDLN